MKSPTWVTVMCVKCMSCTLHALEESENAVDSNKFIVTWLSVGEIQISVTASAKVAAWLTAKK